MKLALPSASRVLRPSALLAGAMAISAYSVFACSDEPDGTATPGDAGADRSAPNPGQDGAGTESGGPTAGPQQFLAPVGADTSDGKRVFRFETFGNEGFWTAVLKLPQGMKAVGFTPAMAIAAGLHVDADAIPAALKATMTQELTAAGPNPNLASLPSFTSAANLEALIEANAVVGVSARNIKLPLNGVLDVNSDNVFAGESVGISCAFCHGITDGSVYSSPTGGGIGARLDGLSNHNLNVGASVAIALNSRAFYPTLALDLVANKHGSVSRLGPKSATNPLISATPTEAEVDDYLKNPALYPVGMFDDAPDGDGAPMHITPFFRPDLAAPWGSEGSIHEMQNFSNLVYTALLDPTNLIGATVPATGTVALDGGAPLTGAQQFEYDRGGPAGLEIIANYKAIIEQDLKIAPYSATNPNGYPYVGRVGRDPTQVSTGLIAGAKVEGSPIGIQVNQTSLKNMTAYLNGIHPPAGVKTDAAAIARGRTLFRQRCTSCHNDDQSKFVPENIVPFNSKVELYSAAPSRPDLFPAWDGMVAAERPGAPAAGLVPVRDYPGTFDDKLIIIEASNQGQPRGDALPMLMDLARKPAFLHDDSVREATPEASLDKLLDPARGTTVPHPFYLADTADRAAVVAFLRSLDDQPLP